MNGPPRPRNYAINIPDFPMHPTKCVERSFITYISIPAEPAVPHETARLTSLGSYVWMYIDLLLSPGVGREKSTSTAAIFHRGNAYAWGPRWWRSTKKTLLSPGEATVTNGPFTGVSRERSEPVARPRRGRRDVVGRHGRSQKIDIERAKDRPQLCKYVGAETHKFVTPGPGDAVGFHVSLGWNPS